ncbi:DUF2480 family protein [Flavihumibacter sp. RY-1]|uniref:DUF2480 family protein n=1 Tax=Flavihumibacter fluminis TaxID=2909236 RepID=A0ABS9BIM3_9BACT|nr:DUF2480 family protein [Flavihumibacter fluminis]MCF1715445.1 DUF2480 family protein [Flavihumibacter fluminis]
MADQIVNKVAESGLITLDLEVYLPREIIVEFDLANHLFMGLILKEKEFREAMKQLDWEQYRGKMVAVTCSADAIIPMWAYMLVVSYLQPVASAVYQGSAAEFRKQVFLNRLSTIDATEFDDKRVVIKGCGDQPIGEYAYFEITRILLPHAKSIMYGEPCSTVPVFKKR